MDGQNSDKGYCVGDDQTMQDGMPASGTFDRSPFSIARGFDIAVTRHDMKIVWSSSHGTPSGNENLTGAEVLAEIRSIRASLP